MEQVEANVASLMAGKVPIIFGGLSTTMAMAAYPMFQEGLPGLPFQGLLERIILESVQVSSFSFLFILHCSYCRLGD